MADRMPNYALEKARLELDRDRLRVSIQASRLRILEVEDEKSRILVNIQATEKAIVELDVQVKSLIQSASTQE